MLSATFKAQLPMPLLGVASVGSQPHLSLLDDPLEWDAFSREVPGREGCWESHVMVEGMHCAACSLNIEETLKQVPGVLSASVSSGSRRAQVVWSSLAVKPSVWMEAVAQTGYSVLPANDAFANAARRQETRTALWRWLVAGLCMMQVMMYAWPAYIAEPGDLSAEMEQLLRWASWVLTLPVVFFSCGPFFQSALRDVAQRKISMDLPVALGMLITFMVSTAGTFDPQGIFGREVFFDSLTMFVFFLLTGRWLELRLRDRTAGSLDALMNRLPESVERQLESGDFERVAIRRLHVNDILRIHPGDVFPADGLILEGHTQVDEALLTGESRPLSREPGARVIAGSSNLSGVVSLRIEALGTKTRFAQIVRLMEDAATTKPRLAQQVDRLAKPFLFFVLLAATSACLYWWQHDPGHALMVAVAVLVVTCPCALSLATPAALLSSAGRLARTGTLVRRLQALEALAKVSLVMFDKTGTLTRDAMVLADTQTREGVSLAHVLDLAAALATHSMHPASRALVAAHEKQFTSKQDFLKVRDVRELAGQGVEGVVSPTDKSPLKQLKLGSAAFCGLQLAPSDVTRVCLCDEEGWLASFNFSEDLRVDAADAVRQLKTLGLGVHIISGDGEQAVQRVARQLDVSTAYGDCTPQDKLAMLQKAQQNEAAVAVVGDGLNDGLVLAAANVSFAFGKAIALAKAQADFVVMGDQLVSVVKSIVLARKTMRIVHQNLWWALGYNAVCVPLAVAGWLPAWLAGLGMAASSLLVVLNALRLTTYGID